MESLWEQSKIIQGSSPKGLQSSYIGYWCVNVAAVKGTGHLAKVCIAWADPVLLCLLLAVSVQVYSLAACCCVSTTQLVASVSLKYTFCHFAGLVRISLCEIRWSVAWGRLYKLIGRVVNAFKLSESLGDWIKCSIWRDPDRSQWPVQICHFSGDSSSHCQLLLLIKVHWMFLWCAVMSFYFALSAHRDSEDYCKSGFAWCWDATV